MVGHQKNIYVNFCCHPGLPRDGMSAGVRGKFEPMECVCVCVCVCVGGGGGGGGAERM